MQKSKRAVGEALQIAVKRREVKSKGENGKIHPFEWRVPKNSKEREIRKPSSAINAKK